VSGPGPELTAALTAAVAVATRDDGALRGGESTAVVELVRVLRSGFQEGSHFGAVAVTDPAGQVAFCRGPAAEQMFPRSTNKPFQAVAMLRAGAALGGADLSVAAGSHTGLAIHTDRVLALLRRHGFGADDLQCPPAMPSDSGYRRELVRAGVGPTRLTMNCSGKHAGMLVATRAAGWDPAQYLDPAHPFQVLARQVVAEFASEPVAATGVDGCGAPLFAISLAGLARAFGRLVTSSPGTHERAVADAMRAHPELVAGPGRDDTVLMTAVPGLLSKGGAEGVHAVALPNGWAVAVKVTDGGDRARMPVIVEALRYLERVGATDDPLPADVLSRLGSRPVLGGSVQVGVVEVVSELFG
jgi:L-asparaginase II